MLIEVLFRVPENLPDDELAELKEEALSLKACALDERDFNEEAYWAQHQKWGYVPGVVEINSIHPFVMYDEDHTEIWFGTESPAIIRFRYQKLKAIYQSITSEVIRHQEEFRTEAPKSKRGKISK